MNSHSESHVTPTLLIADDDRFALETLEALLSKGGYNLISARDGQEALDRAMDSKPDLCVLDIDMPRMNGMEVCRRIKNNPETKFLPVIMVTGLAPENEKVNALEAGCDDFLSKPVQYIELKTRIKSLLRIKSLTDELVDVEVVLFTLARTIEAKDHFTLGHADRVGRFSVALGKALGFGPDKIELLRKGGILHDIGKLGVPDTILQKVGKFNPDEWEIMKKHPVIGCEICQRLKAFKGILPMIRHHHERLDGTGYPDGLKGTQIPDMARIVAVVDIFDALTSRRSYKEAFPIAKAFKTLYDEADQGWWDKDYIKVWEELVKKDKIASHKYY